MTVDDTSRSAPTNPTLSASCPVEVAPRLWWVGAVLENDPFQSHAYLIEAGDRSVLVDPGSALTIDVTLDKVSQIVPLSNVRYLLAHHSDPDCVAGLPVVEALLGNADVSLITEWRSAMLLRHYGARFPVTTIEDLDHSLDLGDGRALRFVPTPYLHFPGAFVTYEPEARALLSADLFGGFNDGARLYADTIDDFEDLRLFHEHYMPSRELLLAGLARVRETAPTIDTILPQHGYVIREHLVEPMFDRLSLLQCGAMAQTHTDAHLQTLIEHASIVHRLVDELAAATDVVQAALAARAEIARLVPARSVSLEADTPGGPYQLVEADGVPVWQPLGSWTNPDDTTIVLDMPRGPEGARSAVVIRLTRPYDPPPHLLPMLRTLIPTAQAFVARLLHEHSADVAVADLESAASHDPLTGVWNRRPLDTLGHRAEGTGVLVVDIDHFKQVNDTYGHTFGDQILRGVAIALTGATRAVDQVVRYGGEEFVVLIPGGSVEQVAAMAERLRLAVSSTVQTPTGPVAVSIGVVFIAAGESLESAIDRADAALYEAKRRGRNRVVVR